MGTLQDPSDVSWTEALSLYERYEDHSDLPALELAIAVYRNLLEIPPLAIVAKRPDVLSALGQALTRRFERLGNDTDIDEAISLLKEALELVQGTDNIPRITAGLVKALCVDCDIRGKNSIEDAVSYGRQALGLTPEDSDNYPVVLITVAHALFYSYSHSYSKPSLDEGFELARRGVQLASHDHKTRAKGLHYLGAFSLVRWTAVDLAETGTMLQSALELRPLGNCDRISTLNALASHYNRCYFASGNLDDLDKEIGYRTEALSLCPVGHPSRVMILCNLGMDVRLRGLQRFDPDDFSQAIVFGRESVSLCLQHHPNRWTTLYNLADTLRHSFAMRGPSGMESLDEAADLLREALSIYPQGNRRHTSSRHALGILLLSRYERGTRELRDIHHAIDLFRDDVAEGKSAHVEVHVELQFGLHLAAALYMRYQHLHCTPDSTEGLALIHDILLKNDSWALHSEALCIKGSFLLTRFDHEKICSDLDEAIRALTEASKSSSNSLHHHLGALSLLAVAYTTRLSITAEQNDIEAAKITYSQFGEICPVEHPARALWMLNRAESEVQPGGDSNLIHALELTYEALTDGNCSAHWRFENASRIFDLLQCHNLHDYPESRALVDKALRVYAAAVHLLPEVAVLGLDIAARLGSLGHVGSLVTSSIDLGVMCAQLEQAVEIVEQCRSFFWSQALRLRAPLDGLPRDLRERIAGLSRDLERESFVLRPIGPSPLAVALDDEQGNSRRRKQTEQLKTLAEQARSYPGFERFMLHDEFKTLAHAAARGPVVLLFPSTLSSGANAVLLQPAGKIAHLHLPEADQTWLTTMKATWIDVMALVRTEVRERILVKKRPNRLRPTALETQRRIVESLWKSVVQPVLDHLGLTKADGHERPRLWWCCGGDFAFLPLHAAGVGDKGCWNYVVSSYTPSLSALLATRAGDAKLTRASARVLLGAVPSAEGFSPLPSTVHEITAIAAAVPAMARLHLPPTDDPLHADFAGGITTRTMLDHIQDANVLHLACHAVQYPDNSLQSAFILRDAPLTIAQLMAVPLPNAFLAFLSACETAKGDAKYTDQTIHLSATMLFAGFKSVIGTMWSMDDIDGPVVAQKVYERLFEGDSEFLDLDSIPYALDEAVGLLRAQGLPPGRWAPYIHLGL